MTCRPCLLGMRRRLRLSWLRHLPEIPASAEGTFMLINASIPLEETLGLANHSLRTVIGTKRNSTVRLPSSIPWDIGRQPGDHRNGGSSLLGFSIFELFQIDINVPSEHTQITQLLNPSNASNEPEQDLHFSMES